MSIKREDLDAGRIDLSAVTTGKRLPLHPGEILRDDFLVPMKISVYTSGSSAATVSTTGLMRRGCNGCNANPDR
jgi:hypothetical protein